MADEVRTEDRGDVIRAEDILPVRSRVSWPAIFAGAAVALAIYLVTMLLGASIGLSVREEASGETMGWFTVVWLVFWSLVALFTGGWIATQVTAGENQVEAIVHGLLTWCVTLALMLLMAGMGVRAGFGAMLGMANLTADTARATGLDAETFARRAGVDVDKLDKFLAEEANKDKDAKIPGDKNEDGKLDKQEREDLKKEALDTARNAAWYTVVGTMLSMAAAVVGALVGSGPTLRLMPATMMRGSRVAFESRQPAGRTTA
jgi:hypothetical protein